MHLTLAVLLIIGNFPMFLNAYSNHQDEYDSPSPEWIRYQQERHHPKYGKRTTPFGISLKDHQHHLLQQQQTHPKHHQPIRNNSNARPGVIVKQEKQQHFPSHFETTSRHSGVDKKDSGNHYEEVEYVDEIENNTDEPQQKTEEEANNANSELKYPSIQGFLTFLKSLKQTWIKNSLFRIEDKIKFLYNLKDNLLRNIERQFTALWTNYGDDDDDVDEDDVNEGRRHKRHKRGLLGESTIEFPPEAALMSINFLTFAVFLIKLVLPIIQSLSKGTMITQLQRYKSTTLQPKMIRLQQKFQEKNNLPIHLKGGAKDKLLYLTTMGLTGCGLVYTLVFLAGYIIFD